MKRTLIIAEAGVNHNGDLAMAMKLVEAAKYSGADIVKFQTFKTEELVAVNARKADYQKRSTDASESQFAMLKQLELGLDAHIEIRKRCADLGIEFLSTAFDLSSVRMLADLGGRRWKIPSGEITNLPLLRLIGERNEETILSTGMASIGEIDAALEVLEASGLERSKICVLHCTTEYPAPIEEVNLKAMANIGAVFGVRFGYSDHSEGVTIPIAAAALGAVVIEKHFTLDRNLPGPDHRASLEPKDLAEMVKAIREVDLALGDGLKRVTPSEVKNREVVRKSIVAACNIVEGEKYSELNLAVRRPALGMSPMEWDRVIGRRATRNYSAGEAIEWL